VKLPKKKKKHPGGESIIVNMIGDEATRPSNKKGKIRSISRD